MRIIRRGTVVVIGQNELVAGEISYQHYFSSVLLIWIKLSKYLRHAGVIQ